MRRYQSIQSVHVTDLARTVTFVIDNIAILFDELRGAKGRPFLVTPVCVWNCQRGGRMDGPIGSGGCYVHVFGMRLIKNFYLCRFINIFVK